MSTHYSRLNALAGKPSSQEGLAGTTNDFSQPHDVPLNNMANQIPQDWQPGSSDGSYSDNPGKSPTHVRTRPIPTNHRTNSALSLKPVKSGPWEHKLHEKHFLEVSPQTDTVRYFDPRRQRRRVFLECLFMWFWTAGICGALAGTMYGFSTLTYGLSQTQKYAYNALITGLSIVLGLAFAAQFKQYAEMMRWRFLASQYRSLDDFEDVLGCDSYRSTLRIMWKGRRPGSWLPSKSQVVAAFWLLVFVLFNVSAALLGLTYSIDVSPNNVALNNGTVSVSEMRYISSSQRSDNGTGYSVEFQKAASNLWGQIGQNFPVYYVNFDDYDAQTWTQALYGNNESTAYWYRFIDLSPDDSTVNTVSTRTVNSTATCVEYNITYGGYAGFNTEDATLQNQLDWVDLQGSQFSEQVLNTATGQTTWMGNSSSHCGPRCAQILVLQSANNLTNDQVGTDGVAIPNPRLWSCNNTVGHVFDSYPDSFTDPSLLDLADAQASYWAGSIGWTGVTLTGSDLQTASFDGQTFFNPNGYTDADGIAQLIMEFTVGAFSASDQFNGPRLNTTGPSPSSAQVVDVNWQYASIIVAGIPIVQFIMLLGVVWFSTKAIILEPSFMTAAHILHPVIQKVGKDGCLFTVDECAERLGEDYKITFNVRPTEGDPGYHDTTFVRDLDVIEEKEGHGYIRGKFPEGRYD